MTGAIFILPLHHHLLPLGQPHGRSISNIPPPAVVGCDQYSPIFAQHTIKLRTARIGYRHRTPPIYGLPLPGSISESDKLTPGAVPQGYSRATIPATRERHESRPETHARIYIQAVLGATASCRFRGRWRIRHSQLSLRNLRLRQAQSARLVYSLTPNAREL